MDKGEDMMMRVKILIVILPILFLQIYGIGHAESDIATVFKYEFPVAHGRMYTSHRVTFAHSKHAMEYKITCVRCHHTLDEGAVAVEETCADCHANKNFRRYGEARLIIPEKDRMEYYILAIHDQCIACHREIKKYNSHVRVPLACWGCHIRKKK